MIEVWDPVVRLGHWVLVGGFLTAYLTEGEPEWLHTGAGYAVAATVGLRVVWGFIGPQHARFTDFVRAPRHALAYLSGLASGSAPRFVGHNPAGGLMALALLASLGATAFTGMAMIAQEGEGPLAPFMGPAATASVAIVSPALADDHEWSEHRDGRSGSETGEGWEEAHELFANLTLILMALHLFGVIASSLAHRENLVRAMIDGRKAT
ncbi:cytochrome B [Roseospira marina]|uniref:Cytochrome B n=2 Tax=Roseospira marina TaxID=140057 RepID=A0A5M6I6W3_9PROT|nr:cytochrome B [Roseospira marina]